MAIDIFLIVIFFIVLSYHDRWFLWPVTILGALGAEIYSLLPFGASAIAFLLGIFILRFAIELFDASSSIANILACAIGIFAHALILMGMYSIVEKTFSREFVWRGALFLGREWLLAAFIGVTLLGMRFSYKLFAYAFVEEKITA